MKPTNLLVGSRSGVVYIVRCDPVGRSVILKTTISAGKAPLQCLVDMGNKSFYCLDNAPGCPTGRLITLAPSELGTVGEQSSIITGGPEPFYMTRIFEYIYILNKDSYAICKPPRPSRSRRRRRSSLAPVQEDTIAESLDELYKISRSMDTDAATTKPDRALENLRVSIGSQTATEVIEMRQVVSYKDSPLIKLQGLDDQPFVIGLTRSTVSSYQYTDEDGSLSHLDTLRIPGAIDMDIDGDIYVLFEDGILKLKCTQGQLELVIPYEFETGHAHSLRVGNGHAFVASEDRLIKVDCISGKSVSMDIPSTNCTLNREDSMIFAVSIGRGREGLRMYSVDGELLGSCNLDEPAGITQMR